MAKRKPEEHRQEGMLRRVGIIAGLISAVTAVVLVISQRIIDRIWDGACDPGIPYGESTYTVEAAASDLLKIKVGDETKAASELNATLQVYFSEGESLCRVYEDGGLTAEAYLARRDTLSERFALLLQLQEKVPIENVPDVDLPFYRELLAAASPESKAEPLELRFRVMSQGKQLESGGVLRSGEPFHIEVELAEPNYLYVVLIDPQDGVSRLFPAALTGDNPVEGRVRIPNDPAATFRLDENTGVERLLIFAQRDPSTAIESLLEVADAPSAMPEAAARLADAVRMRGAFVDTHKTEDIPDTIDSSLGRPAVQFLIDHR